MRRVDWLREIDWPGEPRRLAVCPLCGSDYVVPLDGTERDEHWWVLLRCGSCDAVRDLIASDAEVEALCEEIDAGLARLALGAERLHRERRETEIEIFAAALRRDLISGDDFAH